MIRGIALDCRSCALVVFKNDAGCFGILWCCLSGTGCIPGLSNRCVLLLLCHRYRLHASYVPRMSECSSRSTRRYPACSQWTYCQRLQVATMKIETHVPSIFLSLQQRYMFSNQNEKLRVYATQFRRNITLSLLPNVSTDLFLYCAGLLSR